MWWFEMESKLIGDVFEISCNCGNRFTCCGCMPDRMSFAHFIEMDDSIPQDVFVHSEIECKRCHKWYFFDYDKVIYLTFNPEEVYDLNQENNRLRTELYKLRDQLNKLVV